MSDLDDYRSGLSRDKENQKILKENTTPEWVALKGFAGEIDGEAIESLKFQWVSDPSSPCLVLDNVAAYFLSRQALGGAKSYLILFDRRPSQGVWASEMLLERVEWPLQPVLKDGAVLWSVPATGKNPLSSLDLSRKVAIELSEFHFAYVKAYDKWSAV